MRFCVLAVALVLGVCATPVRADPAADFHALVASDWQWRLRDVPTFASLTGDHRYDDRWTDFSPAAFAARRAHHKETLDRVRALDRAQLPAPAQLEYDLFRLRLERAVDDDVFPSEYLVLNQIEGAYRDLPELVRNLSLQTAADYRALLERLRRFPTLVDQHIGLLKEGMQRGVTAPQVVLREVPKLIDAHLVEPEATPLWQLAFASLPKSIDARTQAELRTRARALIRDGITPAFKRLRAFVVRDYIPHARSTIATGALPNGAAWYVARVRTETTTTLTPDQIHELGLREVARIRAEMITALKESGFKGDLRAFFDFLKTDPRFFFTDPKQLLSAYRELAKRIDPGLPRLFRTLPRLTYGVEPVPAHLERTSPTGYYVGGAAKLGRPGRFFVNTFNLRARPKWEMEALTLHESVPGHHLQIALAQELPEVADFRRWEGFTAFTEGWGLYAESLGSELGLYADPYSRFGQLTYQMWRAVRLVVDTGMHAQGWTRQQAIQFFVDNTSKPEHDIEVEIDRYIVWPGQALAYKLGELKLKELRAFASKELGDRFSIRDFHDQVLGEGALPLDLLDARIRHWVALEKQRARR
ncbi:MAG TPA: DUF885 domain-containing protein [Polyangia bacterium]|nr:DUF885 domain-containing protein [Polyangia bacterium]